MDKVGMMKNKNRRAAFRIYDEVNLFYKKIDEQLVTDPYATADEILDIPPSTINVEHRVRGVTLLPGLKKNVPDWQFKEDGVRNVNISASGIAFNCDDALKEGDYLAIKILLISTMTIIVTCCKVVYCRDSDPNQTHFPYFVGAHFVSMENADRELLVEHVAKHKARQNIVRGFILGTVVTVIAVPDVAFDLLSGLVHFLFVNILHFLHLAFEFIESSLDHFVEHLFHTDTHQTQIIVFYILVAFVIAGLYWLWRALPPFCRRCKENLFSYCAHKKASLLYYWEELSLLNKIKLVVIGVAAIAAYVSFGF
ncbi:PilZ domain-containing protein [Methylobacter tundripaludum]|uniref:PilZ domain-containing protein n=2 Tax=Methylobacter tundripaludum TaxID=173365 RepID=A0A2S6H6U6_9GAMM|nr:PilZ domain-containing protein [Methylobacter tundripaludum]